MSDVGTPDACRPELEARYAKIETCMSRVVDVVWPRPVFQATCDLNRISCTTNCCVTWTKPIQLCSAALFSTLGVAPGCLAANSHFHHYHIHQQVMMCMFVGLIFFNTLTRALFYLRCGCLSIGEVSGIRQRLGLVGDVRSVQIGATRCDDRCENTVLLETQGPCGSVRRCRDDTVTHDTSVQGKCHRSQASCGA